MNQELLELVRIDLIAAFGRGLGSMTADPAAIKAALESEQVHALLNRHVRLEAREYFESDHRVVLLSHARVIGQHAAHLALMDENRPKEVLHAHITKAIGRPFPTVPPT